MIVTVAGEDAMTATHFEVRTHHRLSGHCTVYFPNDKLQSTDNLWNLSLDGYRIDGNMLVRCGMRFELLVLLPDKRTATIVQEARVRWTCRPKFGLCFETVRLHEATRLETYVRNKIV